jgi:hypothetical protein
MKIPDKKEIDHSLKNSAEADEGQRSLTDRMEEDFDRLLAGEEEEAIDHAIPSEEMYDQLMKRIHRQ